MNRKQRRATAKQAKSEGNKELATKIALFDKLPNKCLACQKEFDKQNKEMVMSWTVIVKEEENKIRLYCPDCWTMAQEVLKNFAEHLKDKHEDGEE